MKYKHKGNNQTYEHERNCKIKLPSGEWVDGIVYVNAVGMSFVRTKENFNERFTAEETHVQQVQDDDERTGFEHRRDDSPSVSSGMQRPESLSASSAEVER